MALSPNIGSGVARLFIIACGSLLLDMASRRYLPIENRKRMAILAHWTRLENVELV